MLRKSAREIAAAVNGNAADPVEVIDVFISRILETNPSLNALVGVDPRMAQSGALEVHQRRNAGEAMPLAGVPVIVKDNIWVEGCKISQGSRIFADHVAPEDATAVARLRRAGAVVIEIGNSPEFACKGVTNSPMHGPTRHPLNAALTPGGSSGGNAAALAADFAPIALGTDGGGSGRRPPAQTGTVDFKLGAIPYGPCFPVPFWGIAVLAPMGRSVDDAAILFDAVVGADERDVESAAIQAGPVAAPGQLRVAFSRDLGLGAPIDSDVESAIADGVDRSTKDGWKIKRTEVRWPAGIGEASIMPLQAAGLAAIHGETRRRTPNLFDPDIAVQIERGMSLTGSDVARALEAGAATKRAVALLFADCDLRLCPTAPCVAWPLTDLGPKAAWRYRHAVTRCLRHSSITPVLLRSRSRVVADATVCPPDSNRGSARA